MSIKYEGENLPDEDFSCDKYTELKNGDKITISISKENIENYAEELGKIPSPSSKEYTVEGLGSYIISSENLNDENLAPIKEDAKEILIIAENGKKLKN